MSMSEWSSKTNENSKRTYKQPVAEDVAIVIPTTADNDLRNHRDIVLFRNEPAEPDKDDDLPKDRNIVLFRNQQAHPKKNKTVRVCELHPCYDPVSYPLFFPNGDYGFELYAEKDDNGKKFSTFNFYQYRLMVREDGEMVIDRHAKDYVSLIHRGSRGFQEFL